MNQPTLNDFIQKVGGVAVLFLIVIFVFNKLAPSYVGIAVFITSALVIIAAGLSEYKSKKRKS
jgi:hypothetical protein